MFKLLFVILTIIFIINGCRSIQKVEENATPPPYPTIDIHAHFFNGLDFEPGNLTRLLQSRFAGSLVLANYITNDKVKNYTIARKDRLCSEVDNEWFTNLDKIQVSRSLTTFNYDTVGIGPLFDFVEAASTSRQGIVLGFVKNYPEIDLVTPSMVDLQGFAEGYIDHRNGSSNIEKMTFSDRWDVDKDCYAYKKSTVERHEMQRKLASSFNKYSKGKPAILPLAGFNPLRGVQDKCEKIDNPTQIEKCRNRFDFFQWRGLNGEKQRHASNYAKEFLEEFVVHGDKKFLGIKIYPQVGFYPIANCRNAKDRWLHEISEMDELIDLDIGAVVDDTDRVWSMIYSLPYAPQAEFAYKLKAVDLLMDKNKALNTKNNFQDCNFMYEKLEIIEKSNCSPGNKTCRKSKVIQGLAFAIEFDSQMNKLWQMASKYNFPVITHSSRGGSKQGIDFEKYGSVYVWKKFDSDLRQKEVLGKECNEKPVRLLLAHSWADEDFDNKEFKEIINLVSENITNAEQVCVNFYLDLSDFFFGEHLDQFKILLEDKKFNKNFKHVLKKGRLLYGSDYFMNVLDPDNTPDEYLVSHKKWFNELGLSKHGKDQYFSQAAISFLGLISSRSKVQCIRAKSWFSNGKPDWLIELCD